MVRLCFGSFGTIIQLHSDGVSNQEIVSKLVGIIDPTNRYADAEGHTSSYRMMICDVGFSRGINKHSERKPMSNILSLVDSVNEESLVKEFKSKVMPLIKKDEMENLIYSILYVIEEDDDVDSSPIFLQEHFGVRFNSLDFNSDELIGIFELPIYLACTFRYIVKKTKNKTDENKAFIKMIKKEGFIKGIPAKYHEFKVDWNDNTQTLMLYRNKMKSGEVKIRRRPMSKNTEILKEEKSEGKIAEPNASKPKSGIMLSYMVSPHFSQMVKRIRNSEYGDWDDVANEVMSYKKTSARQMKNFSDESIKKGLDTLHKIWISPDDANSILAAMENFSMRF